MPANTLDSSSTHADAPAAAGGCRVLVIEDNEDARASLRMLLELWGHEVSEAADGEHGLQAAAAHRPAVVLCDIGLPHMDGLQLAAPLRATLGPEAVLAALTGYSSERDRALRAGFDTFLVKPVDIDQLEGFFAQLSRASR